MRADGKNLSLTFDTVQVACVTSSILLDNERADSSKVTFADVIAGLDEEWSFAVTGYPDYATGSWWTLLWEAPAFTPLPYMFRPYGNATATPQQPHFSGFVTVDQKPPIGGDASSAWTFTAKLTCTARPTRVTA